MNCRLQCIDRENQYLLISNERKRLYLSSIRLFKLLKILNLTISKQ